MELLLYLLECWILRIFCSTRRAPAFWPAGGAGARNRAFHKNLRPLTSFRPHRHKMPNYQKTANALFKSEPVAARPDSATGSMRLVTRRGVPVMYATTPRRPVSGREGANCADY